MLVAREPDFLPLRWVDTRIPPDNFVRCDGSAPGARAFARLRRADHDASLGGDSCMRNTGAGAAGSGAGAVGSGAAIARSGASACTSVSTVPAFAKTTAMYGRNTAAAPSTHVYQPNGWMSAIARKHAVRMPIVRAYRFIRVAASSRGARAIDVAERGDGVFFTTVTTRVAQLYARRQEL